MKNLGLILILLFNVVWSITIFDVVEDITLIGHLHGWKKIKYPKWLGYTIDRKKFGNEIIRDNTTHLICIIFLVCDIIVLSLLILFSICIFKISGEMEVWQFWAINGILYPFAIIKVAVFDIYAYKEYRKNHSTDR